MPVLAVCSLALVPSTVARLKPWGLITLLDPATMIETPQGVIADRHLKVGVNDINMAADGLISPKEAHVASILEHGRAWDASAPLLIHCWAGVSRSTASAFMISCLRNPDTAPSLIANMIRTLSPTATPNRLLTSIADDMLGRGGAMVDAIDAIDRGADCWEGTPFEFPAIWNPAL
jgi:predicted protein tyrosine phosphatase